MFVDSGGTFAYTVCLEMAHKVIILTQQMNEKKLCRMSTGNLPSGAVGCLPSEWIVHAGYATSADRH